MEFRWQAQVLTVLTDLRADPEQQDLFDRIAETLSALETDLELKPGEGHMWIVPVIGTDWVIGCSNDEPGLLVVSYLGPALGL